MTGVFAAAYVALITGLGVYRSCTRYSRIMGACLVMDAFVAIASIAIFYAAGALK